MRYKAGTKVRIKDNAMSRAWGIANEKGMVTGPDPRGIDKNVVAVKIPLKRAICEGGIHTENLEIV